jgi:hypothetical protein
MDATELRREITVGKENEGGASSQERQRSDLGHGAKPRIHVGFHACSCCINYLYKN